MSEKHASTWDFVPVGVDYEQGKRLRGCPWEGVTILPAVVRIVKKIDKRHGIAPKSVLDADEVSFRLNRAPVDLCQRGLDQLLACGWLVDLGDSWKVASWEEYHSPDAIKKRQQRARGIGQDVPDVRDNRDNEGQSGQGGQSGTMGDTCTRDNDKNNNKTRDHHNNAQARPLSEQGHRIKAAILRVVGDIDPSQIGVVDAMASAMPVSHDGHDVAGFVEWVVETWTNEGRIAGYRERIGNGEGPGFVTQEIAKAVANWKGKGYRVPERAQGKSEAPKADEPKPKPFDPHNAAYLDHIKGWDVLGHTGTGIVKLNPNSRLNKAKLARGEVPPDAF